MHIKSTIDVLGHTIDQLANTMPVAIFLTLLGSFAHAESVIFPSDDTYVEIRRATTNHGNSPVLKLRSSDGSVTDRFIYLGFDVSTLQETPGQVILELHQTNQEPNMDIRLRAFESADFDELSATWDLQPEKFRPIVFGRESGPVLRFDITEWANYKIIAGEPLQLQVYTEKESDLLKFASSEHSDPAKRPRIICHDTPVASFPLVKRKEGIPTDLVLLRKKGALKYYPDARGNKVLDYGMVGYHQGLRPVPHVPVAETVYPGQGDRTADIQAAIDAVEALPLDASGHRGAVLIKAGYYQLNGVLTVEASGVVIRGEGQGPSGTLLQQVSTNQVTVLTIATTQSVQKVEGSLRQIVDAYVPFGAKSVTVESGHTFQVGDPVIVTRIGNEDWIASLGMDQLLSDCGEGHKDWSAPHSRPTKATILQVCGDTLHLDVPIVDPIDPIHAIGTVEKYGWVGLEECGVETIRFEALATGPEDENHAKHAIRGEHLRNAWFRQVNAKDFRNNCVGLKNCYQALIDDCEVEDYKSQIKGGRRYGFNLDGSHLVLIKNCRTHNGRHDYATGSGTPGPNVFFNCTATSAHSDIGAHHRWSSGLLIDDVHTDNTINVQNRKCSGSGHGWTGAQHMFWNCSVGKHMVIHDPPGDHINWAVGCSGNITDDGMTTQPIGYVESQGTRIGFSLYVHQALAHQRRSRAGNIPDCGESVSPSADPAASLPPSPVDSFTTLVTDQGTQIDWAVANESDILGYNVHNIATDGSTRVVTPGLILSGDGNATYSIIDTGTFQGSYSLEIVTSDLESLWIDATLAPISATPVDGASEIIEIDTLPVTFQPSPGISQVLILSMDPNFRILDVTNPDSPQELIGVVLSDGDEAPADAPPEPKAVYVSVPPDSVIRCESTSL